MAKNQKTQRPRHGWIYKVDPYRVSLQCRAGHQHIYELEEPGFVECKHSYCSLKINSSHVLRGFHPYIIWTSDEFQDQSGYIKTFTAIPLTSKPTFAGLPTTYPINKTTQNGLATKSYALIHQICTLDASCFKASTGDWLLREGQLQKKDKSAIVERLKFFLNIGQPDDDWFKQNATPELIQKIYGFLDESQKKTLLESLIDDLS